MDLAVSRVRIRCKDETSRYGNVEVEVETQMFLRPDGTGAALFTVNGDGLDTLVRHEHGAKNQPVDISKMNDVARKLAVSAFKKAKIAVDKLDEKYLVSPKYEERRDERKRRGEDD